MINFRRTFARLSRSIRARHGHPSLSPPARDNRNTSGLNRVPVAIVDVGAVETLDHLGGTTAGFDGLEDAEGDQGAAANLRLRRLATALLDRLYPTCALLPCQCLTCARLRRHYRAHTLSLSCIRSWAAKQDTTTR